MSDETTINERLARVPMEQPVTCTQCGHVGNAFLPVDKSPEIKAWGEGLIVLAAAVALDEVMEELSKPSTIDGCEKGLALARDRIRCLRNPVAGVPDTAFLPAPQGEKAPRRTALATTTQQLREAVELLEEEREATGSDCLCVPAFQFRPKYTCWSCRRDAFLGANQKPLSDVTRQQAEAGLRCFACGGVHDGIKCP